jgi:hypothetical protein
MSDSKRPLSSLLAHIQLSQNSMMAARVEDVVADNLVA